MGYSTFNPHPRVEEPGSRGRGCISGNGNSGEGRFIDKGNSRERGKFRIEIPVEGATSGADFGISEGATHNRVEMPRGHIH